MEINEIRRLSFVRYVESHGGYDEVADTLGCTPGYLRQIKNKNRPLSEKNARKWEPKLGLYDGFFDDPINDEATTPTTVTHLPDFNNLIPLASPRSQAVLQKIADKVKDGLLDDDDLESLAIIAERISSKKKE